MFADDIERRTEFLKAGNDGLKDTVEKADEIFQRDGNAHGDVALISSSYDCSSESGFEITGHDIGPRKTKGTEYDARRRSLQRRRVYR